MNDTEGFTTKIVFRYLLLELTFLANGLKLCQAQAYNPILRTVEVEPIVAPLGEMIEGDFFGEASIAAISRAEKAIYFFSPDPQEKFVLTNVIDLPDTPFAIAKGKPIVIDTAGHLTKSLSQLAVFMKPNRIMLVSFDKNRRPVFSEETTTDRFSTDIGATDLKANGNVDIITFGKFSLGVSISENVRGRFQPAHPGKGPLGGTPFSDLAFADFNGDLVPDIAALDWVNHKLMIFYGRGDGTFAQPVVFPLRAEPSTLAVADLNGKGYPDIVVGYSRVAKMDVYEGDGFGRFFLRQSIPTVGPISQFAIADFTGDGTMDIAALSKATGEITISHYDPMNKDFQYSGAFGIGDAYDNIVPFYLPDHLRAVLVASSPTKKYLKVFGSFATMRGSADALLPVSSDSKFLVVTGHDSSSSMIAADQRGGITWSQFVGASPFTAAAATHLQSKGTPAEVRIITNGKSDILVSYSDADILSVYRISPSGKAFKELSAGTEFPPFAANGELRNDSLVLVAAYKLSVDSLTEIACFRKLQGKDEFIEKDYSVADRYNYLASALTISPVLSFARAWKSGDDSVTFAYTDLSTDKTVTLLMHGSDVAFISDSCGGFPFMALEGDDSLSLFDVSLMDSSVLIVRPLSSMPLRGSDFKSISLAPADSSIYLAFYNHAVGAVSLYDIADGQSRFVRLWSMSKEPDEITISPLTRSIYFLNKDESYVSLQRF